MTLDGSVALVTGGARRVGRAIAIELARAGSDVAVHYRSSRAQAQEVASIIEGLGRSCLLIEADLCDASSWPAIVGRTVDGLGRLDILVNNASVFPIDPKNSDDEQVFDQAHWESTLRTNLIAPAALCHLARVHLAAHGRGSVINLCDISSSKPWPAHLAYCSSKAALESLTRGLAKAFAPEIRVNGVAPGIAVFPESYGEALRNKLVDLVPMGRPGTPEEVASLVRFLAESADYITGQIIPIDGGRTIA